MFIFTLTICVFFGLLCYGQGGIPQWPAAYRAKGTLEVPYAEIEEPFEAWYDNSVASSRIDYYNGTVKTYQLSGVGKYGTMYKLQPVINQMKCFKTEGFEGMKITPESILPNMTSFTKMGKKFVNGVVAERWIMKVSDTTLTMYLQWREDPSNPGLKNVVPIRFDSKGASHYYFNYEEFSATEPLSDVFYVNDTNCSPIFSSEEDRVYEFNPMKDYISLDSQHVNSAWQSFKLKYNKQYTEQDEEFLRKNIFRQNKRYISSMNRANLSYTLDINHFADYTPKELHVLTSCLLHRGSFGHTVWSQNDYEGEDQADNAEPLPRRWDWRNRGAVTPIKDQSQCGSCWSFSVTGTIEGSHFVKTGKLIRLSEQALVDCSWDVGNMACDGGFPLSTFFWVQKHGIPTDNDYGPYLAQDSFCHLNSTKKRLKIKGFRPVKPLCIDCIKRALIKNGPVSVAISTQPSTFMFYKNGVYDDPKCVKFGVGHAVLIVGYGVMNGQEYWIVKNSWSIFWGMNGYILMAIKGNTCHIMEDLVIVKET